MTCGTTHYISTIVGLCAFESVSIHNLLPRTRCLCTANPFGLRYCEGELCACVLRGMAKEWLRALFCAAIAKVV